MSSYDMYVNYDILCDIDGKLKNIEYDVGESTRMMVDAIQRSQDYLAGNQFEKAKAVTAKCNSITQKTQINIAYAREYIRNLQEVVEEYDRLGYEEAK